MAVPVKGLIHRAEVKTSATYRAEQFAALRKLKERLGDRFRLGVVLGMSDQGYRLSDRLIGLPAAALWELS